jgi:SAM-dependent methyltransferase
VPKGRDSGMPTVEQWESYFDVAGVLDSFGCRAVIGDAVEFGCGYGTFTIPLAQRINGRVFALDIDPLMVAATAARAREAHLQNTIIEQRDFVTRGCGRESGSTSLALLFNILHIEDPVKLLKETQRVLRIGGQADIIHWIHDARSPRGPPLDIRPKPEQCRAWGEQAGLQWVRDQTLPGSPWHWGMVLEKR